MKNIILLFAVFLGLNTINAQESKIKFGAEFEAGFVNFNASYNDTNQYVGKSYGPIYQKTKIKFLVFNKVHLDFSSEIIFEKLKDDFYSFNPLLSKWDTDIYIPFKKITLGYSHSCTHPVLNYGWEAVYGRSFRSSYDKIYIKYSIGKI